MKTKFPDFTDKAVSFVLIGEENSRLLVDAHFESHAGRLFVVGTSPPGASERDWTAGLDEVLAWDRVQEYIVFDSADHYFERLAMRNRRKGRRKK